MTRFPESIEVVDSHTEGEPTRVVIAGWPALESATMEGRREELASRFEPLWRAVVLEPRGHDAIVGALLTPPVSHGAVAGVVFFDNVGPLWMCGHGTIGVVRTLEHLGRIAPGRVRLDTPVGPVAAELSIDGLVTIENVPARCIAQDVAVEVPGMGRVVGDVAYGGNWFFLVKDGLERVEGDNLERLRASTLAIQRALAAGGSRGRAAPSSTTSFFMGPPAGGTRTAATTCSARAGRTTGRPAARARRRRWPRSTPAEGFRRDSATARNRSRGASSPAGSRRAAESSCPASRGGPS